MEKIIWLILKGLIKIKHKPPNFWRVIALTTDVVQQQQQQIFSGAKSSYKRKVQSSTRVALGQMLLQSYTVPTKHDRLHYCIYNNNIIELLKAFATVLLWLHFFASNSQKKYSIVVIKAKLRYICRCMRMLREKYNELFDYFVETLLLFEGERLYAILHLPL